MNTKNYPVYFRTIGNEYTRFTSPTSGIEVSEYTAKPTVLAVSWYDENAIPCTKREYIEAVNIAERNIRSVLAQAIKTTHIEKVNAKIRKDVAYEELRLRAGEPELDKLQEMQDEEERINHYHEDNLFEETK